MLGDLAKQGFPIGLRHPVLGFDFLVGGDPLIEKLMGGLTAHSARCLRCGLL